MDTTKNDLARVVKNVWDTMLAVPVARQDGLKFAGGHARVSGTVQITGGWEGFVTLTFSETLARRVAALMFSQEPETLSDDDVMDAVGELANMTAGGFKTMCPSSSQLSLPVIALGDEYKMWYPGTNMQLQTSFLCEGEPLVVSVLSRTAVVQSAKKSA